MSMNDEVDLNEDDLAGAGDSDQFTPSAAVNAQYDMFDLTSLGKVMLEDLKNFKESRADMVARRSELNKRIGIIDKRIEIVLNAIKTLQTPA